MIPEDIRRRVLTDARGKVLEVGVGTGKNLGLYPEGIEYTGIDLSPEMLRRARMKADRLGLDVQLLVMDAEEMEFSDDSFDTVVSTCVFCSVPDPVKGLREVRRVLKPGGQALLLEHVRSEGAVVGALMDLVNPLAVRAMGANINRRTVENVGRAGLEIDEVEDVAMGSIFKVVRAGA